MNGQPMGTCQVVGVSVDDEVGLDLVLSGPGTVEGKALVPYSPVALSFLLPTGTLVRRNVVRRLRAWAEQGTAVHAAVRIADERATIVLTARGHRVTGLLTDLDVDFAIVPRKAQPH